MQQQLQYPQGQAQQHGATGQQPWGGPFPSLHLWPMQDTFQMKMINLPSGQRVKIGRQTNSKTVPGERNAYFDSKVLSRTHAEIWEQNGKAYIKDVKSSNGTFINGMRLSPEGVESEPYELKSEDMVEFGIDILSEDNRSILHHKVSAKAYCVITPEDAALSARELAHYQNDPRGARRAAGSMSQGSMINPLSQMGPSVMSAGGKPNGLTFDHVLQKLQNELSKSKESGQELQVLNGAMNEVQDTLGGGLPPNQNGSAGQYIPAQFRNPSAEAQAALAGPHGPEAAAFIALQAQVNDTQSSVTTHLDRLRQLEGQIQQQEALKQEIASVRQHMEESKREMELLLAAPHPTQLGRNLHSQYESDDDDDARSVATVMPDDDDTDHNDRNGTVVDKDEKHTASAGANGDSHSDELATRIQTLTTEMAEALQLSKALQVQHGEAMAAVKMLTERVGNLETVIDDRVSSAVVKAEERWEAWRNQIEERWKKERDGWEAERERLRGVVREWEEASRRAVEEDEEREMNEQLSSEDDLGDEEEDEGQQEVEEAELLVHNRTGWSAEKPPLELEEIVQRPKRRRRPSAKTQLAMQSLRFVAEGSSTPTLESPVGKLKSRELSRDALSRVKGRARRPAGLTDKKSESSESGRESADTLRGEKEGIERKLENGHKHKHHMPPSLPLVTVVIVATVAGLIYYRNKE